MDEDDALDEQRMVSVQANVKTFDDALVWVVRKIADEKISNPSVCMHPYEADDDGDDDEPSLRYFVQVAGRTPTS